jgi:hypothetical protein
VTTTATTTEVEDREELECLDDYGEGICRGNVELRYPLSGTGKSFPRCDFHWDKRLREQDRIDRTYPAQPPAWFDPANAGEHWDEDY